MLTKKEKDLVKRCFIDGKVVFLTGAGISLESGIPVFRGKGGLWERYDPDTYATVEGLVSVLRRTPRKFVRFVEEFYDALLQAKPNPAHLSLAALEKSGIMSGVITQNIDNLHQRAGCRTVVELHGNAFRVRCQRCATGIPLEAQRIREMVSLLGKNAHSYRSLLSIFARYCPRCGAALPGAAGKCAGRFRIDVVFFGEMLPEQEVARAYALIDRCRTLAVVGSSLVVYPAASLPLYARQRGARVIEINAEPSALSAQIDYSFTGKAGVILPEILDVLKIAV
jgi:NAD-dependent deacetylase